MPETRQIFWVWEANAPMNRPGTNTGNWRWRLLPGQLTPDVAQKLTVMTATYDRI
jgi:4-alpha-glucanotransferase